MSEVVRTLMLLQVSCLVVILCRPSTDPSPESTSALKAILSVGLVLLALWTIVGWMLVCHHDGPITVCHPLSQVYKESGLLAIVFLLMSSIEAAFYLYLLIAVSCSIIKYGST